MIYTDEQIAYAIHVMNGVLQQIHGEEPLQPDWLRAPDAMKMRVRALVRGYRAGIAPSEAHTRWTQMMAADGWRYGPRKDPAAHLHPNLVPYEDLPQSQRIKDQMSQMITWVLVGGGER
jgi:hypothetical protein